jgi:Uma2 family endonuclease
MMNIQLPVHMDKAAFLAWAEGREENYELVEGRVVMMVRTTRAHGTIAANLLVLIHRQLDRRQWVVFAEFGVDAGPRTLRFPDILVDSAGGNAQDYTAHKPGLLIEILSPSTARFDLGDKAAEYLNIPHLAAYLVLAQDERKGWCWIRGTNGFPSGPVVIDDENAIIEIAAIGLSLPIREIYSGLDLD